MTVVSPGVTRTEFLAVAGQQPSLYQRTMMKESPGDAQRHRRAAQQQGRAGFMNASSGKASVVPGFMNALLAESTRLMPRQLAAMSADRFMTVGNA